MWTNIQLAYVFSNSMKAIQSAAIRNTSSVHMAIELMMSLLQEMSHKNALVCSYALIAVIAAPSAFFLIK